MRRILVVLALSAASCTRATVATPDAAGTTPAAAPCRSAIDEHGASIPTPIDWRGSFSPDDRAWLIARCQAAGPSVIDATPAAGLVPADTDVLTVVTWNTRVGAGDLRAFIAALKSGALTGGGPVGHFVIVMQEVIRQGGGVPPAVPPGAVAARRLAASPRSGPRQDVVSAATSAGLALYYVAGTRNGADHVEDRGNAILSTLPLSGFTAVELPYERLRRVAIAAKIAAGRHAGLRVATAHLDVLGGRSRLWILGSSDLRNRQARALVAALDDGRPILLGGDFNTWADATSEPAVATLRAAWPDADLRRLQPTFRFGLRLDYFFFRLDDGWRGDWHVVDSKYGSDHRPLVARLVRSGR